ncbi:MAG: heat-inducible transcription repressor HrcA, partial [Erysipelothrix sp.]|nr:heat-inducible transcription repressor HrcA [Erysipelothrix sp.]
MLTPRKIEIFKAIVDEFITSAEPVGSKTLLEKYHLNYSSATIRSEMSELEDLGYLEKTHTSSGRVPSKMGYRYYVENLLEEQRNENMQVALRQVFTE